MVAEVEPLLESGTRFEHWSELLDAFRSAVAIIDRDYPVAVQTPRARNMRDNRVKIESAIELVESQLNKFSNRDDEQFKLALVIESLPKAEDIHDEQRLLSTGQTVLPHDTAEAGGRDETIPPDANC